MNPPFERKRDGFLENYNVHQENLHRSAFGEP